MTSFRKSFKNLFRKKTEMGVSKKQPDYIHSTHELTNLITGCVPESDNRTLHLAEEGDVRPGPQCSTEVEEKSVSKEKLQILSNMPLEVRGDIQRQQQELFMQKYVRENCFHSMKEKGTRFRN
jgi:hypothetical protein